MMRDQIDLLKFKCDHCGQDFNEKHYIEHKTTLANKGKCPNQGCDLIFTKDELKNHLESLTCQTQIFSCQQCDFKGNLAQASEHECLEKCMEKIVMQRALKYVQDNKDLREKLYKSTAELQEAKTKAVKSLKQVFKLEQKLE